MVASPPLQVMEASAGSPEFQVRAGRCDGVFVVCERHPSIRSDRMSADPPSVILNLFQDPLEGTESKRKKIPK